MTHMNSVLGSFESRWHYGLPSTTPLHITSANPTHTTCCSGSSPIHANDSSAPSSQAVGSLQSLFSVMDEDGDGRLSLCEMHSLIAKLGITSQSTDLESFIKHTSCTHDGFSLDFAQFTQLYESLFTALHDCSTEDPPQRTNDDCFEDDLLDAFRVYDTNHDGFISAAELATVLLELGLLPDGCGIDAHLGRCQAYIDNVDLDGNGMVDLSEFKSMMTQHHLSTSGFGSSSFSQCN